MVDRTGVVVGAGGGRTGVAVVSGVGSGLGQYVERMLSLTVAAMNVMDVTRPKLLLSVQKVGKGVPHLLLMRII